jgi:hypothetical protein
VKGVTLLVIGSPFYGDWAHQLATSIKHFHPDMPIQVVGERSALRRTRLFDTVTEIAPDDARPDGKLNPSYAKLSLYPYLEFEETIFLDVDAICIDPFEHLFDGPDYQVHTWGKTDQLDGMYSNMLWMRIEKMREIFGLEGPIPGTNTSYQFIRKGERSAEVFETAKAMYHFYVDAGYGPKDLANKWGNAGALPDELFINAALAKLGGDYESPHSIFFHTRKGGYQGLSDCREKGYSFIGYWGDKHFSNNSMKTVYDSLCRAYGLKGHTKIHGLMNEKFVTKRRA